MDDDDSLWTYAVESVSRISPDPEDEEGEMTFAVVFDCNGPNAKAEVEIFVEDVEDEARIIALAMSALHVAMTTWARVTAGRHVANDDAAPAV